GMVSKGVMRRLAGLFAVVSSLTACAAKKPVPPSPDLKARERLAAADKNLLSGCYDCMVSAFREYDALRQIPLTAEPAAAGIVRSAALIALRERELGMIDGGYLAKA